MKVEQQKEHDQWLKQQEEMAQQNINPDNELEKHMRKDIGAGVYQSGGGYVDQQQKPG